MRTTVDKVCTVIALARRISGKVEPVYKDAGSTGNADDPGGDDPRSPMIEYPGDTTAELLERFLNGLGGDELADLLAIAWIGREEYAPSDWDGACAAAERAVAEDNPVQRLQENPQLAEELIAGLQALGYECAEDTALTGAAGPGGLGPAGP